ncbi:MAG TPA: MBL fold metallo-hydrolase [Actinotalea sp.]|jgi:glyoxylase-like metal-dependent hydrolase (beta-lactamase superfamily II)
MSARDPYTGDVHPGGPSAVRELAELTIRKTSVGPMDNNVYLLTCRRSRHQLLIDSAAEPERVLALLAEGSGASTLRTVVTTHRHADHHGALASVVTVTGAEVVAGAPDAPSLPVTVTRPVHHGDVLTVGHAALEVVQLRGHTPGSIALAYREPVAPATPDVAGTVPGRVHLFTGDSLFPGGPGRTESPEAFRSLMTDLEERVFGPFEDDTWVYPGHGADTTLGAERQALPAWWARGW